MARTFLLVALSFGIVGATVAADVSSSDTCGGCHRDIYRMWRGSAHAEATEDPFFYQSYREVLEKVPSRAKVCLECHAPMAAVKKDPSLTYGLSREGVSCDFCHSLVAVDMTDKGPRHRLDIGRVKRGTIAQADSPAHEVAYSELHKSAKLCAPCHEYVSEDGVSVLTTFSEYQASNAAKEGKTCQTCHMAVTAAQVVDPKVVRESSATVNLHEMPGGHSVQQLLKALDIKVKPVRSAEAIDVEVAVANTGAGHAVPTGMPGRRILLVVQINAGAGGTFEDSRVYGKSFKDSKGRTIEHVADYFGPNVLLESDTRIAADEVRRETFRFPVAANVPAYVTVKLHYEHAPSGDEGEKEWLTFFTDRKLLKRT